MLSTGLDSGALIANSDHLIWLAMSADRLGVGSVHAHTHIHASNRTEGGAGRLNSDTLTSHSLLHTYSCYTNIHAYTWTKGWGLESCHNLSHTLALSSSDTDHSWPLTLSLTLSFSLPIFSYSGNSWVLDGFLLTALFAPPSTSLQHGFHWVTLFSERCFQEVGLWFLVLRFD